MLPIEHYLFLSLALFIIGVIGVVTRRNVIVVLMSIELILNAVNINLVAFSRLYGDVAGQVFALFIIADAAMSDLMRPSLYQAYHEIVPAALSAITGRKKVDVVGPICETGDFLAQDRLLPEAHRRSPNISVSLATIAGIVLIGVAVRLIGR